MLTQMQAYCEEYQIAHEQGCAVALTHYHADEPPSWTYDYGFGIFNDQ